MRTVEQIKEFEESQTRYAKGLLDTLEDHIAFIRKGFDAGVGIGTAGIDTLQSSLTHLSVLGWIEDRIEGEEN